MARLRDLACSDGVWQLSNPELRAEFPPLRSLDEVAHNLPVPLTSFIGRELPLHQSREPSPCRRTSLVSIDERGDPPRQGTELADAPTLVTTTAPVDSVIVEVMNDVNAVRLNSRIP